MHCKLTCLNFHPNQNTNSLNEIFIADPDAKIESLAGKLFILIEIESKTKDALKIINFLIDRLNNNYYQNDKIILREKINSIKIEHIFESALSQTNKDFTNFFNEEKIKVDISKINITAGIIYKNQLLFSTVGKNQTFLIYKNNKKLNQYNIINIGQNNQHNNYSDALKIFSNVVNGSIPDSGYCLFTNEALPEYLSAEQLRDIITKLPLAGAKEQIKNTLTKVSACISFLSIIIKNTAIKDDVDKNFQNKTDVNSDIQLSSIEAATEKIFNSTKNINFKRWFKNLILIFVKIFVKIQKIKIHKKIICFILKLLHFLNRNLIKQISFQRNKLFFINFFQNQYYKIKHLNKKKKILIFVFIICLILLIVNLSRIEVKNKKNQQQDNINNLIQLIEQKQNQITAYLLYNNEKSAKAMLEETDLLLKQLPLSYTNLFQKHKSQFEKVWHIIKINNPKIIADFTQLNNNANAENIILIKNKIYSGDSGQQTIYSLDISNNLITALINIQQSIQSLRYSIIDSENNINYFNNNSIIQLNSKTNNISSFAINLPDSQKNIVSIAEYNNRLYLLDVFNNQIYRYKKSPSGFLKMDKWVKEDANFVDAISMSIDGHIYILKSNGQVLKYLSGKQIDFQIDSVSPVFTNAVKINVSEKYIYILEPINKRLVIFDKTGKFLKQYQSDEFTDLKDFAVDKKNKKIYFLNKNQIMEAEL